MTKVNEIWLPVVGYEGLYEVSNFGNVKRKGWIGSRSRIVPDIIMRQSNIRGYKCIALRKQKKDKMWKVHRLVAISFIPNPDNKPMVNHIDGIKTNNQVKNLEWVTAKENVIHAHAIGLRDYIGINNPSCKLTEEDVKDIFISNLSYRQIAKKYNVGTTTIGRVKKKEKWTHVTDFL